VRIPGVSRSFNTGVFVSLASGTLSEERTNQLYDLYGRHLDNSVIRDFALRNELKSQVRTETSCDIAGAKLLIYLVDLIGIEPMTSSMPWNVSNRKI